LLSGFQVASQTLSCDVALQGFTVKKGEVADKPDFDGKVRLVTNQRSKQWLIQYLNYNEKFACTYEKWVLEKPNYSGSNKWYMILPLIDGCPLDLDPDERLLWLTYCAQDYLKARENKQAVLPAGDSRLDSYVHGCRLHTEWHSDQAIAPQRIRFAFDESFFRKGVQELALEPAGSYLVQRESRFQRFLAGHTNGQLMGEFKVQEWKSAGGMEIPVDWTFDCFWYGNLFYRYTGKADNLEVSSSVSNFPNVSQIASITDKRVRDVALGINKLNYTITNGHIPTLEEVKFQRRPTGYTQMPPDIRKTRQIFITLIALAFVIPAVVWVKTFLKTRQTKTKQQQHEKNN
jgi:hypothetical protein